MKRIGIAALTVAALAVATPALADNNNDRGKNTKSQKVVTYQINGTIKAVVAPSTLSVTVKNVDRGDGGKDVAAALVKAGVVNISTDTSTVIRRGNATTFASLVATDKVEIRATCTLTPLACKAVRINAEAVKLPPQHLNFSITGVIVGSANNGANLTIVPVRADDGDDNPLNVKAILGTQYGVLTDTNTVVTKAGATVPLSTITTGFPAVVMAGDCTNATPTVCTAKRIVVIVPTS